MTISTLSLRGTAVPSLAGVPAVAAARRGDAFVDAARWMSAPATTEHTQKPIDPNAQGNRPRGPEPV